MEDKPYSGTNVIADAVVRGVDDCLHGRLTSVPSDIPLSESLLEKPSNNEGNRNDYDSN
jgi:hypothetical protein